MKNDGIISYKSTFESENSRIRIHQGGIGRDGPSQRLRRHAHIYNNHTVLRRRFSDADVLLWFHRHVGEIYELWIDPEAWQLQFNNKSNKTRIRTKNFIKRNHEI